jgi:TPR repeat protein
MLSRLVCTLPVIFGLVFSNQQAAAAAGGPVEACTALFDIKTDKLDGQTTIEACAPAAEIEPSNGRIQNMLARGYWALKQYDKALFWSIKAGENRYLNSQIFLGKAYSQGGLVKQDYSQAAKWLDKAVDQGSGEAMGLLAELYRKGLGVEQDFNRAFSLFEAGAAKGDESSRFWLGGLYLYGLPPATKDAPKALALFEEGAAASHPPAVAQLGQMYRDGLGVPKDSAKALSYLKRAAKLENPSSLVLMGEMYQQGNGVPKDAALAHDYFRRAAEWGSTVGKYQYGMVLYEIQGAYRDFAHGEKMIKEAAAEGNSNAICFLGYLNESGRIKGSDRTQALNLYKQAADAGVADCQYRLGIHYFRTKTNHEASRSYLRAAAKQGHEDAVRSVAGFEAQDRAEAYNQQQRETAERSKPSLSDIIGAWGDVVHGFDKAFPGARDSKVIVVCNRSSSEYYVSMVHRSGVSSLFDKWRSGQAPTTVAAGDCRSIMLGGEGMRIDAYLNVQMKGFFGGYKDVVFGNGDFSYRSQTGTVSPANVVACVPTMATSIANPDYRGRDTSLNGLVQCPDASDQFERRTFSLFVNRRNTSNVELVLN